MPDEPASPDLDDLDVASVDGEAVHDDRVGPDAYDVEPPSRAARREEAARGRRRSRRRIVLAVVLVLVLAIVSAGGWFLYELDGHGSSSQAVSFDVPRGWSKQQIGDALEDRGVIGSSLAFQLYARLTRATIEAGHYTLHRNLGVREAVTQLEKKPTVVVDVLDVGAPGQTLGMIARRVGQLPGRDAQRFLDVAAGDLVRSKYEPPDVHSLEGLTWPAKYDVAAKQDEGAILQMLVSHFDTEMDKLGLANATIPNGLSPYQVLVVASLIQTEAKLDEDRPLIAAVIYNRLKSNMPLQIDSTLLYARGSHDGSITSADKSVDSPYNTYRNPGLPPTPISTLARSSIDAALHPANVPYLYYVVADANGKHAFATTYEEHRKNVAAAKAKGLLGQ
ncbi:MAG: endolytic transglycosylase MltG [Acidimicrobiia bacterium]